jgi:6-phosphogluconate dehydrogenase
MGENLVLNMANHGFTVAVYNRTTSKVDDFIGGRAAGKNIIGTHSIEELCANLKRPRRVMIMVKAGAAVEKVIESLLPYLEPGDIVIDGGNSEFPDSERRTAELAEKDILFIGTGVSGGEEGALLGPSIMPGGSPDAWPSVKPIFQAIAAKTDEGEPCCDWVGKGGAGHFVKMVHNGIEYGDMQMICETYQMMKDGLGMSNDEMHRVFARWNEGVLDSYLIEITRDILGFRDEEGNARSGIRPMPFGPERRAGCRIQGTCWSRNRIHRQRRRSGQRSGAGALRIQDRVLRAGLPADACRIGRKKLGPGLWSDRIDVARRLYHSLRFSRQHSRCFRAES